MRPLTLVVALVLAATGCANGDGQSDRKPGEKSGRGSDGPHHVVRITDDGYRPARLRIAVGDRITFVNRSKDRPHSAQDESRGDIDPSPGDGPTDHSGKDVNYAYKRGFATHSLFPGEPQTVVFRVPRRYVYHCTFHAELTGVIEVVGQRGES